jgi:hypothetical protein
MRQWLLLFQGAPMAWLAMCLILFSPAPAKPKASTETPRGWPYKS